jgi:hypothetical protein
MFDCFYTKYDPKGVLEVVARAVGEPQVKEMTGPNAYRIAWRYLRWHEFTPRDVDHIVNLRGQERAPAKSQPSPQTADG